ncbi:ERO1-like protein alpha isoform X3 [Biomphalaria glabrata]|uniref:ERO1-like protein alpha isoform X3 n=1 Tax=Biomphalaria glabrata TaxID=6526 RepID=A0A2C9KB92_BIOGL|nr:ERO1-like protein alpha isoform X3 [Biomphalaria glabrata]
MRYNRPIRLCFVLLFVTSVFSDKLSWSGDAADRCFCKLQGEVDDCSCKVESLDSLNNNKIYPILTSLLSRNYFRYFKVNLKKSCPFWSDDSRCALRDCHVNVCQKDEVPIKIPDVDTHSEKHERNKYLKELNEGKQGFEERCAEERELGALDATISEEKKAEFQTWKEYDETLPLFCDIDDEHSNDMEYVDLLLNPERYTGYKGPSPRRIWRSIYEENCFKPEKNYGYGPDYGKDASIESSMCLEKRVFFRLISGLHTSINIHLCDKYLFPAKNGFGQSYWDHNLQEFQQRFDPALTHDQGPQRLKNLYFTYLIELRALAKAAPYLKQKGFYTGDNQEDEDVQKGVNDLLDIIRKFPDHFDESQLFKGNTKEMQQLKSEFVLHFRNISRIMDCVGCDKCKLWGKLQVLGMGTALKILFSGDSMGPDSIVKSQDKDFQLTRTEIVALFNAFGRLSSSIHAIETFRKLAS